jgi:hypothetical protein
MAIRYKTFGKQKYAYEIWSEKDTETGKWKQKSKYLGVVTDEEQGLYEKRNKVKQESRDKERKEQQILDYGDAYFFSEFMKKDSLFPVLKNVFGEATDTLLSLVLYKLQGGQAKRAVVLSLA